MTRKMDYNYDDDINGDDGEIGALLDKLYHACEDRNIPMLCYVVYEKHDDGETTEVSIRGVTVTEDGWLPPNLRTVHNLMQDKELQTAIERLMVVKEFAEEAGINLEKTQH